MSYASSLEQDRQPILDAMAQWDSENTQVELPFPDAGVNAGNWNEDLSEEQIANLVALGKNPELHIQGQTSQSYRRWLDKQLDIVDQAWGGGPEELWDYMAGDVSEQNFLENYISEIPSLKPEEPGFLADIAPLLSVMAFIPPLAPFAKAAQVAISLSQGQVGLGDVLNIAGIANFNPLADITTQLNEAIGVADTPFAITSNTVNTLANGDVEGAAAAYAIGAAAAAVNSNLLTQAEEDATIKYVASGDIDDLLDAELLDVEQSYFHIGDSVVNSLAEGDIEGAILDYVNVGMIPEIDLDSGIGESLANLGEAVFQPVIAALGPVGDAIGSVGSAIDDGITQRVIGGVKAAAEPLTTLVTDVGDLAQQNILDPLEDFASTVGETALGAVTTGGDVLADVGEPIKEAIITGGDVLADVGEPIKEAIITGGDVLADVGEPIIGAVGDGLAAADDLISEALPSFNLDFSQIAGLFNMPQVSSTTTPTRTTDTLFADYGDRFKYTTEITTA